jgi:hypothetical protein
MPPASLKIVPGTTPWSSVHPGAVASIVINEEGELRVECVLRNRVMVTRLTVSAAQMPNFVAALGTRLNNERIADWQDDTLGGAVHRSAHNVEIFLAWASKLEPHAGGYLSVGRPWVSED